MIFVTTIHQHLERQARTRPLAPALSARDATLTYAELWQAVLRAGVRLTGLGVAR